MKLSNKQLSRLRGMLREQRLEDERDHGRPRSKSFGGRPSVHSDRRSTKRALNLGMEF